VLVRHYIPRPPLSNFVDLFWLYQGYTQPHDKERLLPNGSMDLVVNLKDDEARVYDRRDASRFQSTRGAILIGAQSEFFVLDTAQQMSVIGVHFKPGGAFPFFKLPAGEFHNQHLSLDLLWGPAAHQLRDRLLEAPTPETKFQILEKSLLAHAAKPLLRHPAVNFALNEFGDSRRAPSIAQVTGQISLSSRRFVDVFNDQVGLTPKLFCRIQRFQQVLRRIGMRREIDWTDNGAGLRLLRSGPFHSRFQGFFRPQPDRLRRASNRASESRPDSGLTFAFLQYWPTALPPQWSRDNNRGTVLMLQGRAQRPGVLHASVPGYRDSALAGLERKNLAR
jgi:AraC-like DNA-binding protein